MTPEIRNHPADRKGGEPKYDAFHIGAGQCRSRKAGILDLLRQC